MCDLFENSYLAYCNFYGFVMKKFAMIIAMLFAAASLSAQNTKKQDWAQFYVFQKDNARVMEQIKDAPKGKCPNCEWKNRKVKAVLMGDSITELWWDLDSTFFKDNNFVGRGISGQTTSEMLVRFRRDVLDLKPQYVFIMAGTNDVAENNGKIAPENILGNLISMVELAKLHNKPAKNVIKLNEMIRNYADSQGIPYIDYHAVLSDENGALPAKFSKDGVHPVLAGYKVMERLLLERFKEIDR